MYKHLFIMVSFCVCSSLIASQIKSNAVKIKKVSQQAFFESKLECQNELSTGSFQNCWLTLLHTDKPLKNAQIYIKGGMSLHQHGLPTSPKIIWSEEKGVYLIQGLKFSMPGEWLLNFKVNAQYDELSDEITMLIRVN